MVNGNPMIFRSRHLQPLLAALLIPCSPIRPVAGRGDTSLRVVSGTSESGHATELGLAMLRRRLPADRYEAIVPLRKPWTAELFPGIASPDEALIVLGNRGAEDAFTHDATTIGFDLAALQATYGHARLSANLERMDRFFRHEGAPADGLRRFIAAGPGGVWDLAGRHLPESLAAVLREARVADSLCVDRRRQAPPAPR